MAQEIQTADKLHLAGLDELHRHSNWFLGLGVALIVLGIVATGAAAVTTVASLLLFGWLLIIGGALEIAYGIWRQTWSGFFIDLLTGVLYAVVGFMIVANPGATAVGLTLLIAMFLIAGGIFRIVAALSARDPQLGMARASRRAFPAARHPHLAGVAGVGIVGHRFIHRPGDVLQRLGPLDAGDGGEAVGDVVRTVVA